MIRPVLLAILIPLLVVGCIMVPALPAAAQTATLVVQEDVAVAEAAQASRIIEVAHLDPGHGIVLDGRLDEEVWQQIPPITDFLQQEPQEGAPPSERTEVRIAHDGNALYIGVIAFDSDPDGILAYQRRRNAGLGTDDRFMWIIDTFGDGRTAYVFEINPAGVMGDALLRTGQGGGVNKSWDGIWEVRTARGDYGWSAEIRIPFRTLNFNPDLQEWGINFQRTIRRKNEELLWSGYQRNQGLLRPHHAGRLTGIQGITRGVGLEVTPFAVGSASDAGTVGDAGLDLSYSITPNLRGALSINTDFAEIEVDQRRLNLTRFPISFPEQRDFFLQASNVFSFAEASGVTPFFSRRIGLVGGQQVPILAGVRLHGQLADTDIGFFQVRTAAYNGRAAEDFTAARLRRNFLAQSTAGALYTRRATHQAVGFEAGPDRHTLGLDLDLETSRFLGDQNLQLQTFWILTSPFTAADTTSFMDRSARGFRVSFPNQPWSGHVSYRELGLGYDPAVGFVSRNGFRRLQPTISFSPHFENSRLVRQVSWSLRYEYLTDMDFQPLTTGIGLTLFNVRFESGDRVYADVTRGYERLLRSFPLLGREDLLIPADIYVMWSGSIGAFSAAHRPISGGVELAHEGFWTGTRDRLSASATLRPAAGVALNGQYSLNRVILASGSVDTHLLLATSSFDLSPWTAISATAQYDNISETVGLFGRFRWTVRPGSDLYVVYTHNWLVDNGTMATLERSGATKVTYTHWF
jgi:hypothetical protein